MRALFYIITLLAVTGCSYSSSQTERQLEETGRLIQSNPKAALQRLNEYDVAEFPDSAAMARWALLYSEAMVANNLCAPTDTIVGIAIDYYGSHNRQMEFRHASRLKALLSDSTRRDELAVAMYLQKEKEFMLYKERAMWKQYLLISLVVLFGAMIVIVWQRHRIRIRQMQNESLITEASTLREGMMRQTSDCSSLSAKLSASLSTRFHILDSLCETYYESQGAKTEQKAIVEKVKSQIESLKSDSGMFKEIEASINECKGNLLSVLRNEWPGINNDDYRLMVYLACHFSNRTIAFLIGESIDVVYKRKSRLKTKILTRNLPSEPLFLSVF